jgi:hypothetical protein
MERKLDALLTGHAKPAKLDVAPANCAAEPERLLSPSDVAARLGRSVAWVRDHRAELGVLPASGQRPRLWFTEAGIEAYTRREQPEAKPAKPVRAKPRRRGRPTGADLLPVKGREAA